MRAVLMEARFRVCATPLRTQRFLDHAVRIVASELPDRIRHDNTLQPSHSVLLHRQWERLNGELPLPVPQIQDIAFGFYDPTGRLTAAKVESIANSVLADLTAQKPPGVISDETVPWILTLNIALDRTSRCAITERHPLLAQEQASAARAIGAPPVRA